MVIIKEHPVAVDAGRPARPDAVDQATVEQLEHELRATRERLEATVEQLETSNEELASSNEELLSMNEELQSSNEELEASQEELQSLNEELETINAQLAEKYEELDRAQDDLVNLLDATLFLDAELRIKRFTPGLAEVIALQAGDEGRFLGDFALKFEHPALLGDVRSVIRDSEGQQVEVTRRKDGRVFLLRITPYHNAQDRIEGAVLSFVDISQVKEVERQATRRRHPRRERGQDLRASGAARTLAGDRAAQRRAASGLSRPRSWKVPAIRARSLPNCMTLSIRRSRNAQVAGEPLGAVVEPEQEGAGPDRGEQRALGIVAGVGARSPAVSHIRSTVRHRLAVAAARCPAASAPRSPGGAPRGAGSGSSSRARTSSAIRSRMRSARAPASRFGPASGGRPSRSRWIRRSSPPRGNRRRGKADVDAEVGGAGAQRAAAPAVERDVHERGLEQAVALLLAARPGAHRSTASGAPAAARWRSSLSKASWRRSGMRIGNRMPSRWSTSCWTTRAWSPVASRSIGCARPARGRGSRSDAWRGTMPRRPGIERQPSEAELARVVERLDLGVDQRDRRAARGVVPRLERRGTGSGAATGRPAAPPGRCPSASSMVSSHVADQAADPLARSDPRSALAGRSSTGWPMRAILRIAIATV